MNTILNYQTYLNLLHPDTIKNVINPEDIDPNEFKTGFVEYLNEQFKNKTIPAKKLSHITERCKKIKCFICLDTKKLWRYRNLIQSFDYKGKYEIINCFICTKEIRQPDYCESNFVIENGIRICKYPCPTFPDIQHELEKIDENFLEQWYYVDSYKKSKLIKETQANVDIKKLANDIYDLIASYAGDITSVAHLLENIKVKLTFLYVEETSKHKWYEQIESLNGKTYIMFQLENHISQINYDCGVLRLTANEKTQHFNVGITIAKPKNRFAEKKCDEWLNENINLLMANR
jgi:hypothetical protein